MVGDYSDGALRGGVLYLCQRPQIIGYGFQNVGLVNGLVPVKHGERALQSHSRIDVFLLKFRQRAVGMFIEVHEHVVPYLDEPSAVVRGRIAGLGFVHDKYFGVLAARTRLSRDPPVIGFGQIKNPVRRNTHLAPAFGAELVARTIRVTLEHRNRKLFGGYSQHRG